MTKLGVGAAMLAAAAVLVACAGETDTATGGTDAGAVDARGDVDGMAGMERMGGIAHSGDDMMGRMQAHMTMMAGMSGDSMVVMMSTHRQMVANMLAQMDREMREMDMASDPAWEATVDSIRADLRVMGDMNSGELRALIPAHRARVMRLVEMHDAMIGDMRM